MSALDDLRATVRAHPELSREEVKRAVNYIAVVQAVHREGGRSIAEAQALVDAELPPAPLPEPWHIATIAPRFGQFLILAPLRQTSDALDALQALLEAEGAPHTAREQELAALVADAQRTQQALTAALAAYWAPDA